MRPWLVLAAVALVPRVLLALYLGVWGEPERWEYDVIAASIHAGEGHNYQRGMFHYAAYAPPVWSYLLAALLALPSESRASIQVVQGLFCLGAACACVLLVKRLGGGLFTARLAGLLVALQPSLLYYSVAKSDPLPLNAFLLSLMALAATLVMEQPGLARSFGFGLLVALATLSRGTPAIAVPILATMLWAERRSRALPPVLAMVAGLFLGLAPWLIRNAIFLGEPMITSTSGENFWRGNNPLATGGVADKTGRTLTSLSWDDEVYSPFSPAIRQVLAHGNEADRQHVFAAEAWRFIREQPDHAFFLFTEKLKIFWWKVESRPEDYAASRSALYQWIYRSELFAALLGLFVLLRAKDPLHAARSLRTAWILVALIVGISVLQSAFYVQGRHRFLIEPLMLIFTAFGAAAITGRLLRAIGRVPR